MSEPLEIQCPGCQKKLRVPAEAAGKRVKCPGCQNVIAVPAAGITASPPPPPPSPIDPDDGGGRRSRPRDDDDDRPRRARDDDDDDRPRRRDRDDDGGDDDDDRPLRRRYEGSGLTALAICMLILGVIGFCWDAFNSIGALVLTPPPPPPMDPAAPPWLNDFIQNASKSGFGVGAALIQAVFALMSLVQILGGIQMLRRKTWGLCLTACIVAMLNFSGCCCLPGIPIGIWGLVLLSNKLVKESFS